MATHHSLRDRQIARGLTERQIQQMQDFSAGSDEIQMLAMNVLESHSRKVTITMLRLATEVGATTLHQRYQRKAAALERRVAELERELAELRGRELTHADVCEWIGEDPIVINPAGLETRVRGLVKHRNRTRA